MPNLRWLSLLAALTLLVAALPAAAAGDVTVSVDGRALSLDQPPIIEAGRTLVPVRAIFEALGAAVSWAEATRTVTATRGRVTVQLTIDQALARVGDGELPLDVAPGIRGGRTLVPLRFVAEAFGARVAWDGETRSVQITSPQLDQQALALLSLSLGNQAGFDVTGRMVLKVAAGEGSARRQVESNATINGQVRGNEAQVQSTTYGSDSTSTVQVAARAGTVFVRVGSEPWREVGRTPLDGSLDLSPLGLPGLAGLPMLGDVSSLVVSATLGPPQTLDGAELRWVEYSLNGYLLPGLLGDLASRTAASRPGVKPVLRFDQVSVAALIDPETGFVHRAQGRTVATVQVTGAGQVVPAAIDVETVLDFRPAAAPIVFSELEAAS